MKKLLGTIILGLGCTLVHAQQNPHFSLFMFNKQTVNPAYVGSKETLSVNANYRTQWIKSDGQPRTFNLGVHTPLGNKVTQSKLAAGLLFMNDQIGITKSNGLAAQLAYRLPLGEETTLSFGLEGSFMSFTNQTSGLRFEDQGDATIDNLSETQNEPNASAGVYLYHKRFYAGLSAKQLFAKKNNEVAQAGDFLFKRHYFAMAGYLQPINENLKLRGNVIAKYVFSEKIQSPTTADFNVSAIFVDRFLIGASYRTDNTLIAMAQVQLTKRLNLGYGIDFKTSNFERTAGASHEIYLGFDLGRLKGPFTTPRFITYF